MIVLAFFIIVKNRNNIVNPVEQELKALSVFETLTSLRTKTHYKADRTLAEKM